MSKSEPRKPTRGQKRSWKGQYGNKVDKKPRTGVKLADLKGGSAGFFVTCEMGRERQTQAQMLDWLTEIVEKIEEERAPSKPRNEAEIENHSVTTDLLKGIAAEVAHIKSPDSRTIEPVIAQTKSSVIFRLNCKTIDPVDVASRLLNHVATTGELRAKAAQSIRPIQAFCFASCEELSTGPTAEILTKSFADKEEKTFAIRPRMRGTLSRSHVVDAIAKYLKTLWPDLGEGKFPLKANLNDPDIVVLVEGFKNIAGLSVIPDFRTMHNLRFSTALEAWIKNSDK